MVRRPLTTEEDRRRIELKKKRKEATLEAVEGKLQIKQRVLKAIEEKPLLEMLRRGVKIPVEVQALAGVETKPTTKKEFEEKLKLVRALTPQQKEIEKQQWMKLKRQRIPQDILFAARALKKENPSLTPSEAVRLATGYLRRQRRLEWQSHPEG